MKLTKLTAVLAAFALCAVLFSCQSTEAPVEAAAEPAPAVEQPAPEPEPAPEPAPAPVKEEPVLTPVIDNGEQVSFDSELTGLDLVYDMKFGWNLGNTLDATDGKGLASEKSWRQPFTTREMIDGLAETGITTIRIPTSWHNHIIDTKTYTIDPAWMARVKEIVDWAIEDGMYVILNCHHDNAKYTSGTIEEGSGYYPLRKDEAVSKKFLEAVWTQVSAAFNNSYDEHLIFETMNEPRLREDPKGHEWGFNDSCKTCEEAMDCLIEYNQLCLDTIRASGGNNAQRFVMVPSLCASPDAALSYYFELPEDSVADRLIVSVHMYTPYVFAMQSPGDIHFSGVHKANISSYINKLYESFITNDIPVVVGEMGATNKDNLKDREEWFSYFVEKAYNNNISCIVWDNGAWKLRNKDYSEKYGYYDRQSQTWYFPTLIEKALEACETEDYEVAAYEE